MGIVNYYDGEICKDEYFSMIYKKYSNSIYRMSLFYLKNVHDAEEVVSETFIKIIEKSPILMNENHEKAWLIKTCANLCKDMLKSSWFKKRVSDFDLNTVQLEFEKGEMEALELLLNMPLKYRTPIYLHYYEGYSTKEIGDILKINESTIRSQLSRGRKYLKDYLEGDE